MPEEEVPELISSAINIVFPELSPENIVENSKE